MKRLAIAAACVALAAVLMIHAQPNAVVGTPASSAASSGWDEPTLTNPVTIDLSTAAATQPNDSWAIPQTQDAIFTCSTNPVKVPSTLSIWGGHNVIIQGCELEPSSASFPECAYPHNQANALWINDVSCEPAASSSPLKQGIQLQEPGTVTAVMRDVVIGSAGSPLSGSVSTNHAECLQTWSGPQRWLIDGFSCYTGYQGFFLLPNQQDSTTQETVWDFRHVDVHGNGAFDEWLGNIGASGNASLDLNLDQFYDGGSGEPRVYPSTGQWQDVIAGSPPDGSFVTPNTSGASGPDEPGTVASADGAGVDPVPLAGEQQ